MDNELMTLIITLIIITIIAGLSFLIAKVEVKKEIKKDAEIIEEKKKCGFYPVFSEYGTHFIKFEKGYYTDTKNLSVRCFSDSGNFDACITIDLLDFGIHTTNKDCAFVNPHQCEFTSEEFLKTNNIAVPTGRWVNIPMLGTIREFKFNI